MDQVRLLGRLLDNEPRIDRDAVAANTGTRLVEVDARVQVRQLDDLPRADPQVLGDQRQLVRQRDVDVTVGVLHDLDHLGRGGVRQMDLPGDDRRVEHTGLLGAGGRHATDDAVVLQ